jgi:hypothetical protein
VTSSYTAALLIFLGLFLIGGVVSFIKQGVSKAVTVVLALGAIMAITAGILRWKS